MRSFIFMVALLSLTTPEAIQRKTLKTQGIIMMDLRRNDSSFDLFLPCKLDSSISFDQNLKRIKKDTCFRIIAGNLAFHKDVLKIRNESVDNTFAEDSKFVLVLPVDAIYDTASERLFKNTGDKETLLWPFKFSGRTVSEYYTNHWVYLKSIHVITFAHKQGAD